MVLSGAVCLGVLLGCGWWWLVLIGGAVWLVRGAWCCLAVLGAAWLCLALLRVGFVLLGAAWVWWVGRLVGVLVGGLMDRSCFVVHGLVGLRGGRLLSWWVGGLVGLWVGGLVVNGLVGWWIDGLVGW